MPQHCPQQACRAVPHGSASRQRSTLPAQGAAELADIQQEWQDRRRFAARLLSAGALRAGGTAQLHLLAARLDACGFYRAR